MGSTLDCLCITSIIRAITEGLLVLGFLCLMATVGGIVIHEIRERRGRG